MPSKEGKLSHSTSAHPLESPQLPSEIARKRKKPQLLNERFGDAEVPVHSAMQKAFDMTVGVLSDILDTTERSDFAFRFPDTITPKRIAAITVVQVPLLSKASRPENTLPARFNVHLLQDTTNAQTAQFVEVKTSVRSVVPKPQDGLASPKPTFIRSPDEAEIPMMQPEFFSNDPDGKRKNLRRELQRDFKAAEHILAIPPSKPELNTVYIIPRKKKAA